MKRALRQARIIGSYVLVPLASAIAPLLVIPAATARSGADAWASIAVGLSVGLAAAVVGELGWSIVGPQRVARAGDRAPSVYEIALASRLAVTLPLVVVVIAVTSVLTAEHRAAAVVLAVGVACGGLSPSWYWTGLGRPQTTLLVESLPRVVATSLAAGVIALGGPLEAYGCAMVVSVVVALGLTSVCTGTRVVPDRAVFAAVPRTLREQGALVAGRGVTTIYRALPTTVLAVVAPELVAVFAAVDRPMRLGLQFLAALPQRMQAWVAVDDHGERERRTRAAIAANAVLGAVAGAVFAVALPVVAPVLFSGTVSVPPVVAVVGGALVIAVCASRGFGLALVTHGHGVQTTTAAVVAATVGLPGVVVGAGLGGTVGVVAALVVAEVAGVLVQWVLLVRLAWTPRAPVAV